MKRPAILNGDSPLLWSTGTGNQVWDMLTACRAGDLESVVESLAQDPALVRCQHAYRTPLYFAVLENQTEVAKLLLDCGANPLDIHTDDTMLEIASMRRYCEMERLLRKALLEKFNASEEGEPLAKAIREGDVNLISGVLDQSPELLTAGDLRSNQPIHWATMTRQIPVLEELLERGANINARRCDGARPIQLTNGDYHFRGWRDVKDANAVEPAEVFDYLRARGAFVDIATAASIGDVARVQELLHADHSLANKVSEYLTYYPCSGSPLRNAAAAGHMEVVKILLDAGADPNLREEGIAPCGHALYSAAAAGHNEIAELLLKQGAFPNPEVESSGDALSRAVANEDERMIDLLCSYGAAQNVDILAYNGDVRTAAAVFAAEPARANDPLALVNAANQGHAAFVRLLLRYHPDLPQRIEFPSWSVGAATPELNDTLFSHGLDPSQSDWLLVTPLHWFAKFGDEEKARIFLERGADVNARDEEHRSTPLAWAARFDRLPMIKLFLEYGAAVSLPDDQFWATPLAWAERYGHTEIIDFLNSQEL